MDFFDEEYNKQRVIDNSVGYNNPPPQPQRAKNRVLQKILTVVAFVAVFVVGIVLGQVVKTRDTEILEDVMQTFKDSSIYYDDETWEEIKAKMLVNAGTGMLQTVDKFGFLMGPEQLYDVYYPSSDSVTATYGISFIDTTTGYYVHSLSYGSGAYVSGLKVGDLVILITRNGTTIDVRNSSAKEIQEMLL